jgi:hypothetical protein
MSSAGIYVFDSEGDETFSRIFSYDEPRLCAEGKYAVAYDLGGNSVIFLSSDGVICDIVTEQSIVSASVNSRGYLAVCTREVGYFGSVTVYNSSGTAIYKWYSGAARVLSAQVRGSSELIVLTVGSTGSSIISMSLSSEQEKARFDYDGLIIDTVLCDNNIVAVTTGELIFMSASLEENARYDFGGRYLEFYDAGGKFISIVLGDYIVGGERTLINVGTDGDELGSVSADGEIYDLDAAYSRVAVMYYDSVCVYDRSMELLGTVEGISGAEKSILMVDGTVIAAGAFSAHTYGYSLDE